MVIPVKTDFAKWETITLSQMFVKTYHDYSGSKFLGIAVDSNNVPVANANKFIYIPNNDREDNSEPGVPTGLKITQTATGTIRLTWTDPVDLDLQSVEVYR